MIGDEPGDQYGPVEFDAKKAEAIFKIALALRNSAFSAPQALELGGFLGRGAGLCVGVDVGLAYPLAHRLGRATPRSRATSVIAGPLRLVLVADLGDHPHRARALT